MPGMFDVRAREKETTLFVAKRSELRRFNRTNVSFALGTLEQQYRAFKPHWWQRYFSCKLEKMSLMISLGSFEIGESAPTLKWVPNKKLVKAGCNSSGYSLIHPLIQPSLLVWVFRTGMFTIMDVPGVIDTGSEPRFIQQRTGLRWNWKIDIALEVTVEAHDWNKVINRLSSLLQKTQHNALERLQ